MGPHGKARWPTHTYTHSRPCVLPLRSHRFFLTPRTPHPHHTAQGPNWRAKHAFSPVHAHGRRKYAGAARLVTVVELHVTYYSPRAWACYQRLLDPLLNWGGYGYDVWLQNYMVDHCALREPRMGILDGYTAIHAHQWFRKEAGQQLWLATRAHNGSRLYQMDNMYDTMRQRGTPVRHAPESVSSRESPRNESILQLHNTLCNKYNRALNVSRLERGVQLAADDALLVRGAENALLVGAELRERHRAARARGGGWGVGGAVNNKTGQRTHRLHCT